MTVLAQAAIGSAGLVVVALISFFGARLASRDTRQANREASEVVARIDERKVDLEEFREFKQSQNERIAALDADLEEEREARRIAERRAEEEREARKVAERRTTEIEETARRLAQRLTRSERRVAQLERVMEANELTIPAAEPDDS